MKMLRNILILATMISGCGQPTTERLVPIVDIEELRSGRFRDAGRLLIRMSQSEWDEANIAVVDSLAPTAAGPSLLIFEIPTPRDGEIMRFLKPTCGPCSDVVFTDTGWLCEITDHEACPLPELRCREVRIVDLIDCLGSCPDDGNCEYRAVRLRPDVGSILMQSHADELTAIWIEARLRGSGFTLKEFFVRTRVIVLSCGCG